VIAGSDRERPKQRHYEEPAGVRRAMDQHEIETHIKKIAARTERIEQILPTLATKEDFQQFATKDDLKVYATKEDLKAFATKEDLKAFATKEDLKAYPTRNEVKTMIEVEGERTRRHFDVVAEDMKASIEKIAEGHEVLGARIEGVRAELKTDLAKHDRRIKRLEVGPRKK
jgi:hypothetical protein